MDQTDLYKTVVELPIIN